jgi:hypothetical protein
MGKGFRGTLSRLGADMEALRAGTGRFHIWPRSGVPSSVPGIDIFNIIPGSNRYQERIFPDVKEDPFLILLYHYGYLFCIKT